VEYLLSILDYGWAYIVFKALACIFHMVGRSDTMGGRQALWEPWRCHDWVSIFTFMADIYTSTPQSMQSRSNTDVSDSRGHGLVVLPGQQWNRNPSPNAYFRSNERLTSHAKNHAKTASSFKAARMGPWRPSGSDCC